MIIELERMTQSCLIVTHRVVMRILLGYLLDWTHDEMVRTGGASVGFICYVSDCICDGVSSASYGCSHSFVSYIVDVCRE
jgi:broad specificity phosphatase PhoE